MPTKRSRSKRELNNNPTHTNSGNLSQPIKKFKTAGNKVREENRLKKPPSFANAAGGVLGKLKGEDQGVKYIQELIMLDFEQLKEQLDPNKPLVVIITTHGSLNNRQNDTFFNRVVELAEQIKRRGMDWLKWLTERDEPEQIKATYVKANIDGEYQEYCPEDAGIFQTEIAEWFERGDFSDDSIKKISADLHHAQFGNFNENLIQAIETDNLHMWRMANIRGKRWSVSEQLFTPHDPIRVNPWNDKVFWLSGLEALGYHWTDMLIHVVGKNGELIPFPRLFSDHAHLFGGAETRGDRKSITYSRLLLLMSKFNRKLIFFDYTCGTGNRAENDPHFASIYDPNPNFPFVPRALNCDHNKKRGWAVPGCTVSGGAPKTKKRKTKMSQKSKKTKGVSNKKGKSHKYARGHRHTRKN